MVDEALTRTIAPITGPVSTENKVNPSRRAQIQSALGLVPKNAVHALGGDADADADDAPAVQTESSDGGESASGNSSEPGREPAAAPENPPAASTLSDGDAPAPAPVETPAGASPGGNPWDKVTALESENLELKRRFKKLEDQISVPRHEPAPGPQAPAITAADLAADPIAALKRIGLSYQDLTGRIMEGGPTPRDALNEVERVRKEALDAATAARGEAAAIRNQLTRDRIEMGLQKTILGDPRFDVLKADPESAITAAISEMARHFQETGERLPDVAILARVNQQWVDRLKKLDSHGAVRKLLTSQSGTSAPPNPSTAAPQPPAAPAKQAPNGSAPATLTNDVHASSPPGRQAPSTGSRALDRRTLIHKTVKELVPPNALGDE